MSALLNSTFSHFLYDVAISTSLLPDRSFSGQPSDCLSSAGSDPGLDEELCRRIGAQLAELGDRFESEALIKPVLVESLVNEILDNSLTEDVRIDTKCCSGLRILFYREEPHLDSQSRTATLLA